ncbi:cytidylate kinase family protein [Prevotella aurantiaca]|nr:cytidylate kinase family protein [Prevotella aurantiaca]
MIITIARQSGCGALHIGEKLSAIYGIPFYTRKGLLEMAKEKGVFH